MSARWDTIDHLTHKVQRCANSLDRDTEGRLEPSVQDHAKSDARFWASVARSDNCWLWTRHRLPAGYGLVRRGGVRMYAHRVAWSIVNGPIPDGMLVCHRCDNPPCCNPDHLFLGSHLANMQDRDAKNRGFLKRWISDATIKEIIRLYALDSRFGRQAELGRQFGLDRVTINMIVRGKERYAEYGTAPAQPLRRLTER